MAMPDRRVIMLSAGEASGDLHGATLCHALRALEPTVSVVGMGGPRMAAAGVEIVADPTHHAVVGVTEAVGRVPALYRAYRALLHRIRAQRPDALVLIDFPEFNMRLGRAASRAGVPVVYFVPPQLWAWRPGRARGIARFATRVLTVLPFEREIYEAVRAPVEYVGHPLLDVLPLDMTRDAARERLGVDPAASLIGLLPGSRRKEVERILPDMLEATRKLAATDSRRHFLLGAAPTVDKRFMTTLLEAARKAGGPPVEIVEGLTHELMAASDVLMIASGTATLEAALLNAPMVVCYRVSRTTEWIGRRLALLPWISLPNIILRRFAVPELLQAQVAKRLAGETLRLLEDSAAITGQRASFKEIRGRLGEPGVAQRSAQAVLEVAARGR
jgi:lipid-A-disaccharide synthase